MLKIVTTLLIILCFVSLSFSQENVYHLGFLYLGSDTLDAEDGGCTKTEVIFDSLLIDSLSNSFTIVGKVRDEQTGEPFNNSWGRIFLGRIDTVKANTWLGFMPTGRIIRKSEFKMDDLGNYKIEVFLNEKDLLIFTGVGCNVKYYSVNGIIDLINK
jgi:hypothetical protein